MPQSFSMDRRLSAPTSLDRYLSSCNRLGFAKVALQQIAKQTFPLSLIEVILVDDAADASEELVGALRGLDVIRQLDLLRPHSNESGFLYGDGGDEARNELLSSGSAYHTFVDQHGMRDNHDVSEALVVVR